MQSCPTCRLFLESAEWRGIPLLVCRSCGGVLIRSYEAESALVENRNNLTELNTLYPGIGVSAAFQGLSWPCPACSSELAQQPIPLAPDFSARICPSCRGIWLDSESRSGLAATNGKPAKPEIRATQDADSDPVLEANANYARGFRYADMAREPKRKVAVLTCMDSRMRIYEMLGMEAGDLNVIRNAGGIVTEDTLRSLMISHHFLGTREFFVINHTDCGLLNFDEREFRAQLVRDTGASSAIPATFHPISDLEENVREQIRRLRSHPWIPDSVGIRGFVYDVKTGILKEVRLEAVSA